MKLGDLVRMISGPGRGTPEMIEKAVMGALGELVQKRGQGAALEAVWTTTLRGGVAVRIVTRDTKGVRLLTHFSGEGRARAVAVQALWLLCQSAVGHSTGTAWEATARELAAAGDAVAGGDHGVAVGWGAPPCEATPQKPQPRRSSSRGDGCVASTSASHHRASASVG